MGGGVRKGEDGPATTQPVPVEVATTIEPPHADELHHKTFGSHFHSDTAIAAYGLITVALVAWVAKMIIARIKSRASGASRT